MPAHARRLLVLLAALSCLLLTSVSSALAAGSAQTRVRAFDEAVPSLIGFQAAQTPCSHTGSTASGAGSAVGFCVATEDEGQAAPDLEHLSSKIERQMQQRGWTPQEIQDAYDNGEQVPAVNKANGAAATRYVNPTTGKSVVIENDTGQVIHVGGQGFKYGPGSGDLP